MYNKHLIVSSYGKMITDRLNDGWNGYLLTFMFKQIAGSGYSVHRQMEREVERVYAKSLTWIIKKKSLYRQTHKLPLLIGCPDYPVPKGEARKQSLRDVTVNDGRHFHAVEVVPPWSVLKEDLGTHFDEKQSHYATANSALWRIHSEPITHDAIRVNSYVMKALVRGWVSEADILILPRSISELRDRATDL